MVMWDVRLTNNAEKDKKLLKQAGLENKAKKLLDVLSLNPYQNPPSYEKLSGDLTGYYSRRINIQHRLVYRIDESKHMVIVHAMWSHYN
ncbi:MAG: Txe/YoeB family addiction module toxin [Bacilli bacterium]|jgi:Txe/YoeB family toxin of toxin-antitoxin system